VVPDRTAYSQILRTKNKGGEGLNRTR
jgi:hypothetical protein